MSARRLRVTEDAASATAAVTQAVSILLAGGIVAYPTETFYGLAVDALNPRAIERLFELKGRAGEKAFPLISASLDQIEQHVGHLLPLGRRLATTFWPGPLTLIIEAASGLPSGVTGGSGTVAVRIPGLALARELASSAQRPLTSTSANRSGRPAASTADAVLVELDETLDAVIDAGPSPGGQPTTIVDVTRERPVLIRAGAVPWERVLESLR